MGTGLSSRVGAGRDGIPNRARYLAAIVGRGGPKPHRANQGADDAMKFGFIPTEGGPYFQEALTEAVAGEALGFDSVWLEEHHSIRNHYWPSPLMALAGSATRTTRQLLGTDIAVLPFYHPVRVAEDVALLDIMSG